jgi:hypothetical protein
MQFLRKLRAHLPDIALIILGGIALCWIAFKNRYPIVYPDTGTYLYSGWDKYVPTDRPIGYGLFVKATSLRESLWFTILFQGIMTSYAIWLFIRSFVSRIAIRKFVFVTSVGLLCFATGLPIKTGIIVPDIFTPVGLLFAAVLLLRTQEISRLHIVIAVVGVVTACCVHHSNVYILILLLVFTALMKWRKRASFNLVAWRRIIFCAALIPVWWLTAGLINYTYSDKFFVSRNGDIFLAGHFIHDGTMRKFLCSECEKNPHYIMCEYKDSLAGLDFLWDYNRSPLYKYGGWDNSKGVFGVICKDIITTPKMWPWLVHRALGQSAEQFFSFQLNGWFESPRCDEWSPATTGVKKFYANEFNQYGYTEQYGSALLYEDQNRRQNWLLFFSVAAIILFLFGYKKEFPRIVQLIIFMLFAMYCNALICGAISIINPRYQSRVVWLLPLLAIVVLAESGVLAAIGSRIKQAIDRK